MKICIVGTGYVGLVAGVCFADVGHDVICVDKDQNKINQLNDGQIPIYEAGLEDILSNSRSRIKFTTDLSTSVEDSQIIFVTVGTPEMEDGSADMAPTTNVVKDICQYATTRKFIVLKSTVPVGTAKNVAKIIKENANVPHEVISNPEFLKEGAAVADFMRPDRVVIGCSTAMAKDIMARLYEPFTKNGHPIYFMSNVSAELTKYAANSFLSVKISFINELAALADKTGADINEVKQGFSSDRRINPAFFYAGVGYGGSCFPKDVQALIQTAKKNDTSMSIVTAADAVNDRQKLILFEKVKARLSSVWQKRIAIWGLSFKPLTDDVREAPAGYLIKALTDAGATVIAYDPVAAEAAREHFKSPFAIADTALEATVGADALLIVTEWNEFRNPDFVALKENMKEAIIFDGRNILNIEDVKKHGFEYHCIGRQIAVEGKNES